MNQDKKQINPSLLVIYIIQAIILIIGLTITTISVIQQKDSTDFVGILTIGMYLLIIFYALVCYNQPHGNLMKYLFLVYSFVTGYLAVTIYNGSEAGMTISAIIMVLVGVVSAFMAGRLNRIKENQTLALIVIVLLLTAGSIGIFVIPQAVGPTGEMAVKTIKAAKYVIPFNHAILWGSLFLTYYSRFDRHIEAGIQEDKE